MGYMGSFSYHLKYGTYLDKKQGLGRVFRKALFKEKPAPIFWKEKMKTEEHDLWVYIRCGWFYL